MASGGSRGRKGVSSPHDWLDLLNKTLDYVFHDWLLLAMIAAWYALRSGAFDRQYYVLVSSYFDRQDDLSRGPLNHRWYQVFDDYVAAAAVMASLESPPGRHDDEWQELHNALYAVEATLRSGANAKAYNAVEKVRREMKKTGRLGYLGFLLAETDPAGTARRRQDLKDRWIVLENTGDYTTVGRRNNYPSREEITGFSTALQEAGKGGWLCRTTGSHHVPGKVPNIERMEALGRYSAGMFDEAVAVFSRRLLSRNGQPEA